ncbi:MAG: hypothetical protein AAFR59_16005, partial [Bacteroidota bacterium]
QALIHGDQVRVTEVGILDKQNKQTLELQGLADSLFVLQEIPSSKDLSTFTVHDLPTAMPRGNWRLLLKYDQMYRAMPQPLSTPIALSQNPFAFARQPGASLTLMREWNNLSAGVRIGLDDAYYYADYQTVERVVYNSQIPNMPQMEEALKSYVFVGTNYSIDAVGRWTFGDAHKRKLRPYVEGSIGLTQADGFFVQLLSQAESYTSLVPLSRSNSKVVAKALSAGETVPLDILARNGTRTESLADFQSEEFRFEDVDLGSGIGVGALNQEEIVSLNSPTYLSYALAAGLTWQINKKWSLDAQASFLRRSSTNNLTIFPLAEAVTDFQMSDEEENGLPLRNSLLPHVNYYRLSAGMSYRF